MALTTTQIAPIAALVAGILILIMPNIELHRRHLPHRGWLNRAQ